MRASNEGLPSFSPAHPRGAETPRSPVGRALREQRSTWLSLFLASHFLSHIKLIHCHGYPPVDETFQCIDSTIETGIQYLDLFSCKWLQHIVR